MVAAAAVAAVADWTVDAVVKSTAGAVMTTETLLMARTPWQGSGRGLIRLTDYPGQSRNHLEPETSSHGPSYASSVSSDVCKTCRSP